MHGNCRTAQAGTEENGIVLPVGSKDQRAVGSKANPPYGLGESR
jgi:hypothetical protein